MARRAKNRRSRRDVYTPSLAPLSRPVTFSTPLTEIEDRREFHPLGPDRPARSFDASPHTITVADRASRSVSKRGSKWGPKIASQTKAKLIFQQPDRTLVCVRRHTRKEVLHALKKTGRGGSRRRKPRRSWTSEIGC